MASAQIHAQIQTPTELDPRFHPTRQAVIADFAVLGQIHPDVAEASNLPADTVLAEIDLTRAFEFVEARVTSRSLFRNPPSRRDIAIVVAKSVPYADIEQEIAGACGDVLERQWLFDVYEGQGIEPGFHSLAIALQFRKAGNFTDEEANQVRNAAVAALESLGAKLR